MGFDLGLLRFYLFQLIAEIHFLVSFQTFHLHFIVLEAPILAESADPSVAAQIGILVVPVQTPNF